MRSTRFEVKIAVLLTNTTDMALKRRNLLKSEEVRRIEANALIDTGAVSLVLPSLVVERLGLARPFKQVVEYADGRREEVDLTEPVLVELMGRHTVEEAVVLGDEVIVGQTILEKTDLHVDCREGRLLPNPAHPDQPVLKMKWKQPHAKQKIATHVTQGCLLMKLSWFHTDYHSRLRGNDTSFCVT